MTAPLRLAVVRDFRAEGWPSMDLCADQLLAHLPAFPGLASTDVAPPFRRRAQLVPLLGRAGAAFNADRLLNRAHYLPRHLGRVRAGFDWFHVVDHSYASVAQALPAGRVGVYCHDLDAFRCLTDPAAEPRPRWFRRMARRTLDGLRSAAAVFHSTAAVRGALLGRGWVPAERLVHAPYGVSEEFVPVPAVPARFPAPFPADAPFVLHVGSCIPRKRIDVLLEAFALARVKRPGLRLVQVGGAWTSDQRAQLRRLVVEDAATQMRGLTRAELAELYRRAAAVLQPSEAEGFGLPVVEALACGAAVLASDIPTLREAGGLAATYLPVGVPAAWANAVLGTMENASFAPPHAIRREQAARFSWAAHAKAIGETYLRLDG